MFTSKAATATAATAAMLAVMNRSLRSLGFLSVLIAIRVFLQRVFLQRTGFRMIGHDVTGCRVSDVEVAADAGNSVRVMRPGNGGRNLRMATAAGGFRDPLVARPDKDIRSEERRVGKE